MTARASDPAGYRLLFAILQGREGEWWRAVVLLTLVLGAVVALGAVAGPVLPAAVGAAGTLAAGGVAVARRVAGRATAASSRAEMPDIASES